MRESEITDYQAKYFAHELQRSYANDHVGKLAGLLFDAQVEPKPHQIDAALFVLQTPFLKGVILADEVGLGKTIEAGIVISQYWAERKRKILVMTPSSLRQQWSQELLEKFYLPSILLDSQTIKNHKKEHGASLLQGDGIYICSYEFANNNVEKLKRGWDLIVADEAHKLRNYYTGRAKVADSVAQVMTTTNKTILVTATPLQNRLEELFGLVSVFDPKYFYSLDAFKERYVKNRNSAQSDDLSDRVAQISKRTLRKTAQKYIKFTKRLPLTVEFESAPEEQHLYDLVNSYLQRDELYAFSASQRHLSALILRKRLGSSTYAVASTLENIASRLSDELASGQRRDNRGALFVDDELTYDEIEEFGETPDDTTSTFGQSHTQFIQNEINELRQYAALARSIKVNKKAIKLNEALDLGFEKLQEIGAPQKAIIFTDSTKTQEYIASSLRESGRDEGLVLFNGSNNNPETTKIYQQWLIDNKDSDLITGIATADRRKAIVDFFRDKGKIMIATEAAAEGINLQFCSMIVNYDLPWNPQRVEQRIGRCHRFGQKFNVVVVNFSNKGNIAEQRILELLSQKFHLFESVFGASDQILGSIEDGLDFEKQIAAILNKCRTENEISKAFKELEEKYAGEISEEMKSAKSKVFDNLDPNVQDRLKAYDEQSEIVLNKFERLLISVTKHQLADIATFENDDKNFTLHTSPVSEAPAGKYYFKSQPIEHAHQYRYASPLAQYIIKQAQTNETLLVKLTFSISSSERPASAVKKLIGQNGIMVVKKITFKMKANLEDVSESYMLSGALTHDGDFLDSEYVSQIMDLTCTKKSPPINPVDESLFKPYLESFAKSLEKEVQTRNSRYYDQQEEIMYRKKIDQKAASEGRIRDFRVKEHDSRRKARAETDPLKQLEYKKEARKWELRAEAEDDRSREERRKNSLEADKYLAMIEESLKGNKIVEDLFSINWEVVE
jgi:ERCC4-related helicase